MSSFRTDNDRYDRYNTSGYTPDTYNKDEYLRRYKRRRIKKLAGTIAWVAGLLTVGILLLSSKLFSPLFHREQGQPQAIETGTLQAAEQESAAAESESRYFRRQLSGDYQLVYDKILSGLQNHLETINLKIDDREKLNDIYDYVVWDYPELFWANLKYSYTYSTFLGLNSVELSPEYQLSSEELSRRSAYVAEMAESVASQFTGLSDYEKVKGVYEYLVNNTVYDSSLSCRTPYELFFDGKAVCEGYARAAQYILKCLGMEAVYTVGYASNDQGREYHAWLKVPIEGEYYNVDVTWGDPNNPDGEQLLSHAYLCVTDADISATHSPDPNPYPPCAATHYNYYVMENRLLSTYDEQLLLLWFSEDIEAGRKIEFRAINDEVYRQTLSKLFDGRRYFNIIWQIRGLSTDGCSYSQDDTMRVISILY